MMRRVAVDTTFSPVSRLTRRCIARGRAAGVLRLDALLLVAELAPAPSSSSTDVVTAAHVLMIKDNRSQSNQERKFPHFKIPLSFNSLMNFEICFTPRKWSSPISISISFSGLLIRPLFRPRVRQLAGPPAAHLLDSSRELSSACQIVHTCTLLPLSPRACFN